MKTLLINARRPYTREETFEITATEGEIPGETHGTLSRNGPPQKIAPPAGNQASRPFDGDAPVRARRIGGGRVHDTGRLVRRADMTHPQGASAGRACPRSRRRTAPAESRTGRSTPAWFLRFVAAPLCLALVGCLPWVGPLRVRIDTGGVPYDDFVIRVGKQYGRGHGTEVKTLPPRIVSSEEDLTLGRMLAGPTLTSIAVVAFHPAFDHAWTMRARSFGSSIAFPAIHPVTWTEILENEGPVSMKRVYNHLESIRLYYVPTFPEGKRHKLRRYLPGLRELVARARFLAGDLHKTDEHDWHDEASARKDLVRSLEAIDRLLP